MKALSSKMVFVVLMLVGGICLVFETRSSFSQTKEQGFTQASLPLGKAVFENKCAACHGTAGKGDGRPAALLNPKPRDFTSGKYKFRSTESGSIPTDEDLLATIQNGLHGTSMPDWKPFLRGDSLQAVLAYVKSLSPRFSNEKPKVIRIGNAVPSSASSIAAGKKVFEKLQCGKCHGEDGKGTNAIATGFKDDWGNPIRAVNLTEPWTFRGGSTSRDIYLRFRTGIDGTPMPSYVGTASDQDMWNLANYVGSLARKPVWSMNEQELRNFYDAQDQAAKANPVKRGEYLVEAIDCAGCHSTYTPEGAIIPEMKLAGGLTFDLYPFGKYVTRNLTSDKETGLGNWTDAEIKRALTQGINRDGRKFLPFPMPWTAFAQMKDEDLNAIIAYLRTVPAVHNKIPDPEKPGFFSYMWGKFRMLILKEQIPAPIYPMPKKASSALQIQPSQHLAAQT
ncbi:MAG: c-type cytochrome, partial [Ignavibacteriales bacterium]|nr:c-type cytochrome [Ignavibacteriales bacterium]